MAVKAIPDGQHSITAYLGVDDASAAIDCYTKAFGANEVYRLDMPGGKVGHAELKIGDSSLMLGDVCDAGPLGGRKDLSPDEIRQRAVDMFSKGS